MISTRVERATAPERNDVGFRADLGQAQMGLAKIGT
jgi:hypothetical protein